MKKFQISHGDQMIVRETNDAFDAAMEGHKVFHKELYERDLGSIEVSTAHAEDDFYGITSPSSEIHFTYWVYEVPA